MAEGLERSYLRLQEEHAKALSVSRERIGKWERFKGDYEALQERLHTLPEQLTHEVMVPFGKFGYMPGKLYHTNEVMVLLGDNWFAKRSARQALEMVERRKQYVVEKLEEERQQLQDWEARLSFTEDIRASQQEHENVKEIKEDLRADERETDYFDGKRVWKARKPAASGVPPPRPAFPKTPSQPSRSPQPPATPPRGGVATPDHTPTGGGAASAEHTPCTTDKEVWARLDQLEKEEEEGERREEEEEGRGSWKEEVWQSLGSGSHAGGVKSGRDGGTLQITVKHSEVASDSAASSNEDTAAASEQHQPLFCTPGDISRHPPPPPPAGGSSVEGREGGANSSEGEEGERRGVRWDPHLVQCEGGGEAEEEEEGGGRRGRGGGGKGVKMVDQRRPLAFSGQVVERVIPETKISTDSEKPRKISKFKASRKSQT